LGQAIAAKPPLRGTATDRVDVDWSTWLERRTSPRVVEVLSRMVSTSQSPVPRKDSGAEIVRASPVEIAPRNQRSPLRRAIVVPVSGVPLTSLVSSHVVGTWLRNRSACGLAW
jgi:hypothetical protein